MRKPEAVIFDWAGTTIDFGSMAPVEAIRGASVKVEEPRLKVADLLGRDMENAEIPSHQGDIAKKQGGSLVAVKKRLQPAQAAEDSRHDALERRGLKLIQCHEIWQKFFGGDGRDRLSDAISIRLLFSVRQAKPQRRW